MRVLNMNELENVAGGGGLWDKIQEYGTAIATTVGGVGIALAGAEMAKLGITTTVIVFGATISAPALVFLLGMGVVATGAVMLGVLASRDSGGC